MTQPSKYQVLESQTYVALDTSFAQTEIGDSKQPQFHPQVKVKRWENEANFSVRLVHDEKAPQVVAADDKIHWLGEKVEAHFYDVGLQEGGGYEFEIVLKEPPSTNVISLTLQTKGLDFFKQPTFAPRTGEPLADNVQGSYAVYHQSKTGDYTALGGKNYGCGKAFHIYRPRIEDAAGRWCWGELNIDEQKGLLTVTIPQDFLNQATYPVRHAAGLTLGYTSIGASVDPPGNDQNTFVGLQYGQTGTGGGTLSNIKIAAFSASGGHVRMALYTNAAGTPPGSTAKPANLVTNTDTGSLTVSRTTKPTQDSEWTAGTPTGSLAASTWYWICANCDASAVCYCYDVGVNYCMWYAASQAYSSFPPSTAPTLTSYNLKYSLYATYAASGINASLAGNLTAVTGAASAAVKVAAAPAGTLAASTGTINAKVKVGGTVAGNLAAVTGAVVAPVKVSGTLTANLPAVTGTANAAVKITGLVAGNLAALTGTAQSRVAVTGIIAGDLTPINGAINSAVAISGVLTGNLTPVTGLFNGSVMVAGSMILQGTLAPLTGSIVGAVTVSGALSGQLAEISGDASAEVLIKGALSGDLPALIGDLALNSGTYLILYVWKRIA